MTVRIRLRYHQWLVMAVVVLLLAGGIFGLMALDATFGRVAVDDLAAGGAGQAETVYSGR
jgi:hypothetical protein